MEISVIGKQYSDLELKLSNLDKDFDLSKFSSKSRSKPKNSSSNNMSQKPTNNNPAYEYPGVPRQHDFRKLQYSRYLQERNSRKSSTHNDLSNKADTGTQHFEDFEEDIEAIMSGNGSKGSKDSRKLNKRSNTVHISHSSGAGSEHKSSSFFKSKVKNRNQGDSQNEANKNLKQSSSSTGLASQIESQNNKTIKNKTSLSSLTNISYQSPLKKHLRHNTNHFYEVDDIKEVSEDEDAPSENHYPSIESGSLKSRAMINYHKSIEETFTRTRNLKIPLFQVKSMSFVKQENF